MRKSLVSPVVMPASLMAAIHDGRLLSASICSFSMKMESVRSIRHRKGQRIRIYIFKSETRKELRALAGDPAGGQTPAEPRSLDCYGGGRTGQGPSP